MADTGYDRIDGPDQASGVAARWFNMAGAVVSVGLVVGLAVWAYDLTMRDVTDVPVVRALEGPMRVQPDDPGGRQAAHQGLTVNRVQAEGHAEPAADRLILAPEPIDLIESDGPVVSAGQEPAEVAQESPEKAETVEGLAHLVALNVAQSDTATGRAAETPAADDDPALIPDAAPGITVSPRPKPRPDALARAQSTAEPVSLTREISPETIPSGARLVQLGAFDSADDARTRWHQLEAQFGEYFRGKSRVVEPAESGGKAFYRLRAAGFADLSEARRFCLTLIEEDATCIAVVVR